MADSLETLRARIRRLNLQLLELFNRRARLVSRIRTVKRRAGLPAHAPEREREMLDDLLRDNRGPFPDDTIRHLFRELFQASLRLIEEPRPRERQVARRPAEPDRVFRVGARSVGRSPVMIAGPCAVEDEAQMDAVGRALRSLGVGFLRGGAFKPRSSPYDFQGLGGRGLEILRDTGKRYGLTTVSEVTDTRRVELVASHVDVLQIGARSMYHYDLLREVGRTGKPVLLKRGFSATLEEFLSAAEYVYTSGGERLILCERGIRTFETQTRNTLDLAAVALLRQATALPVIVDVSHAAGRRDILAPLARAALAVGAQGIMVEVHPHPAQARSDSQQQLDLPAFRRFLAASGWRRSGRRR